MRKTEKNWFNCKNAVKIVLESLKKCPAVLCRDNNSGKKPHLSDHLISSKFGSSQLLLSVYDVI